MKVHQWSMLMVQYNLPFNFCALLGGWYKIYKWITIVQFWWLVGNTIRSQ